MTVFLPKCGAVWVFLAEMQASRKSTLSPMTMDTVVILEVWSRILKYIKHMGMNNNPNIVQTIVVILI